MRDVKAPLLLKHNIDTMLVARGQTRKDLAMWCRRSESWMSQIFTNEERGIPLKYLDRIADFFGIATYQLLQPGISPLTERRAKTRRSGRDRRISQAVLSERAGDVDVMQVIRALSRGGREQAMGELMKILDRELRPPPARAGSVGGPDPTDERGGAIHAPARERKHRKSS